MRLKINGEQVSYTLEKEQTLAEVVRGVQHWLGESGFVVSGIRAGAQELLETPASIWGRMPIDSVEELDVRVMHTGDVRIEHWQTLDAWLGMLAEEVQAPGPALEELLSNLPETLEGMKANPFLPPGADAEERLKALFRGQGSAEARKWPAERKREAVELITGLRDRLAVRIDNASQPREAVARCVAELRSSLDRLPEVSVLLQTGRDRSAMDSVIMFADNVQALLSLVPFLPPDPERGRLIAELTPVLRDLVAAFDAKDSVLIGDLLEYEVTPRVKSMLPQLEKSP